MLFTNVVMIPPDASQQSPFWAAFDSGTMCKIFFKNYFLKCSPLLHPPFCFYSISLMESLQLGLTSLKASSMVWAGDPRSKIWILEIEEGQWLLCAEAVHLLCLSLSSLHTWCYCPVAAFPTICLECILAIYSPLFTVQMPLSIY